MIPRVAASERGEAQTRPRPGVVGPRHGTSLNQANAIESAAIAGASPVAEGEGRPSGILSTAGHEESCRKQAGPSAKAKYSWVSDSGPVPWGKGEKNRGSGVKENLKPYAYKKSEPVDGWWRAFCRMNRRVTIGCEVKRESAEPQRKRVLIGLQ